MPIGDNKLPELPDSVNELIADRAIRHALYLERYKTQVVNEILTEFNRTLAPELVAKIEKSLQTITARSKKLQQLFKDNGDLVRAEYTAMEAKLYEQLRDYAKVESAWIIKTLESITPVAVDFVAPSANILKALVKNQPMEGALVKDWFDKLAKDTAFNVNRAIQNGMIEGEGIEDIVRRIKGTRAAQYTDGILNASRHNIRAVVRTSVSNVAHTARNETYASNSDVVKGIQWVSTLDSRTCLTCMNLDGKVFDIGEKPGVPHHNCRCSDSPILKSWKELGIDKDELPPATRASMNGQVPETTTYNKWLKKQSSDIQDEALGAKRANLFRENKLSVGDFVNDENRPMKLIELEKKIESKPKIPEPKTQLTQSQWEAKLSDEQRRAIRFYQDSFENTGAIKYLQSGVEPALKISENTMKKAKEYLKYFEKAIDSCPDYKAVVYRGMRLSTEEIEKLVKGSNIRFDAVSSTAKTKKQVIDFLKKYGDYLAKEKQDVVFEIDLNNGARFGKATYLSSEFEELDEVLVRKNSSFEIDKVSQLKNYLFIRLKQI